MKFLKTILIILIISLIIFLVFLFYFYFTKGKGGGRRFNNTIDNSRSELVRRYGDKEFIYVGLDEEENLHFQIEDDFSVVYLINPRTKEIQVKRIIEEN